MGLFLSLCYLSSTLALLVGVVLPHPSSIVLPKYTYPADYNKTIIRQPGPEEYKCYTGAFYDHIDRDRCAATMLMLENDIATYPEAQTWGHGGRMGAEAEWEAPGFRCMIRVNGEWDDLPFGGQFRYFSLALVKLMVRSMMNRCGTELGGPGQGGYVEIAPKIWVAIFGTEYLQSTQSGQRTDGTEPNIPPWNRTFEEGMGVVPARLLLDEQSQNVYRLPLPETS